MEPIIGGEPQAAPPIKDSTEQDFVVDVMDPSRDVPVVVDFWAPWCGPCKQLTPALEKAVSEARGSVRLVKINVDENQSLSAQLGIQSIPTVFAFKDGRPVDGFQGALPESQIKQWIDQLIKSYGTAAPPSPLEEALDAGEAALEAGDAGGASALFGQVLAREPANPRGLAGLMRCYLSVGETSQARELIDGLDDTLAKAPEIEAVRAALELAETGEEAVGHIGMLEAKLAVDANDHQARLDLAMALHAKNQTEAAMDHLLEIVRRDRGWNDEAARLQLLKLFEALGPTHELTIQGRRKLSTVLFA